MESDLANSGLERKERNVFDETDNHQPKDTDRLETEIHFGTLEVGKGIDETEAKKPIRYTLVEAEEDNDDSNFAEETADDPGERRGGRKGTTWRKLSLGDAFPSTYRRGRGRGRGGRRGRGRGRGRSHRPRMPRLFISKYANYQNTSSLFTPHTFENWSYYPSMAAGQVEFYFSTENLARDTFLRSYMDCEGYVPIAFICNFPAVACFGAELNDITECLRNSEVLEIDEENETIRLKNQWEVWLFPNPQGGRGVPKWLKVEQKPEEVQEDGNADQDKPESDLKEDSEIVKDSEPQKETEAGQTTDSGDQIKQNSSASQLADSLENIGIDS